MVTQLNNLEPYTKMQDASSCQSLQNVENVLAQTSRGVCTVLIKASSDPSMYPGLAPTGKHLW